MRDKTLKTISGDNLKSVIDAANMLHLLKDDIIQIITLRDIVYLVYQA